MSDNEEIAKALVTMLNEKKTKSSIDALLQSLTGDDESRQDWRGGGKRGKVYGGKGSGKGSGGTGEIVCYGCKKPGVTRNECTNCNKTLAAALEQVEQLKQQCASLQGGVQGQMPLPPQAGACGPQGFATPMAMAMPMPMSMQQQLQPQPQPQQQQQQMFTPCVEDPRCRVQAHAAPPEATVQAQVAGAVTPMQAAAVQPVQQAIVPPMGSDAARVVQLEKEVAAYTSRMADFESSIKVHISNQYDRMQQQENDGCWPARGHLSELLRQPPLRLYHRQQTQSSARLLASPQSPAVAW